MTRKHCRKKGEKLKNKKKILFLSLMVIMIFTFVACNENKGRIIIDDVIKAYNPDEDNQSVKVDIKTEKEGKFSTLTINKDKKGKDEDINLIITDAGKEETPVSIEIKKRNDQVQIGTEKLLESVLKGEKTIEDLTEEEYKEKICDKVDGKYIIMDKDDSNDFLEYIKIQEQLDSFLKEIKDYKPMFLNKDCIDCLYNYTANNQQIKDEFENLRKYLKENKTEEEYNKINKELEQIEKDIEYFLFKGDKESFKISVKTKDGESLIIDTSIKAIEDLKLKDFEKDEITKEDIQSLFIPLIHK